MPEWCASNTKLMVKYWLRRLFIDHWPRKLFSLLLAIIIYLVLSKSMTTTKTFSSIPVKVTNLPPGKTIEGLNPDNFIEKRVTLTLTGNKKLLEDLDAGDLEVVIDATQYDKDFIVTIAKHNLISLNPDYDLVHGIHKITHKNFIIKMSNAVQEKVPVFITQPIGQPPKGYHFLDVWPYQLYITISGPEDVVHKLKQRGLKFTLNLSDITKETLDAIPSKKVLGHNDVITFFIPDHWKQLAIPAIANSSFKIDDDEARALRIDFVRYELVPLTHPIPVSLFFPPSLTALNPQKVSFNGGVPVDTVGGQKVLTGPLFAKGVSELFVAIVGGMLEVSIIVEPKGDSEVLEWSLQIINAPLLEDRYVSAFLASSEGIELETIKPTLREEYLRGRFRSYMQRMQLCTQNAEPLMLQPVLQGNKIVLSSEVASDT